jgi:hypothetical protein
MKIPETAQEVAERYGTPVVDWERARIMDEVTGEVLIEVPASKLSWWSEMATRVREDGHVAHIQIWDWADATGRIGEQIGTMASWIVDMMLLRDGVCGYRVVVETPEEAEARAAEPI